MTPVSVEIFTAYEETIDEDGVQHITFDRDDIQYVGEHLDMFFYSSHVFVTVLGDGEELYRVDQSYGRLGHTPGNIWNSVLLPDTVDHIEVQLIRAYPSMGYAKYKFYLGYGADLFWYIFITDILLVAVGIVIVSAGALMIAYGALINKRGAEDKVLIPLGIFAVIFGIWSCNTTDAITIVYPYRVVATTTSFLLIGLLPVPFLAFSKAFLGVTKGIGWNILSVVSVISLGAVILLQVLDIKDLKETVLATHIVLVATMLYITGYLIKQLAQGKRDRKLVTFLIGFMILFASLGVDIFIYYTDINRAIGVLERFGFLVFVALLGLEAAESSRRMFEEWQRAEVYKEMATKDWLTGLGNRNALAMKEETILDPSGYGVLVFDLNNLKQCNDSYGHNAGDAYLKLAAECIHKVFGGYGNCYRIGGDEFCCLVEDFSACPVEELLEEVKSEEQRLDRESKAPVPIQIACGYALYDRELDQRLKDTRHRADKRMYLNKEEIKKEKSM